MEIQTDVKYIKESLEKNDNQHKEIIGKIDSFVHAANERFLDKSEHKEAIEKIGNIEKTIDNKYVTKDEFRPIQKLAYSLVGAILLAILGAILSLVL